MILSLRARHRDDPPEKFRLRLGATEVATTTAKAYGPHEAAGDARSNPGSDHAGDRCSSSQQVIQLEVQHACELLKHTVSFAYL